MINRREVADLLGDDVVVFDGLDDALLGYVKSHGNTEDVLIYSYTKIVKILMERDGVTEEDAREFADYNTVCLHAGQRTPVVVFDFDEWEVEK